MKLGVNIPDMTSHRIDADMTISRDHLIAKSFYQLLEHFFFPFCKVILQPALACLLKRVQYFFGNSRRQGRPAVKDIVDGFQEMDKGGVLEYVPVGSSAETFE